MTHRYTAAAAIAAVLVATSAAAQPDYWETRRGSSVNITTCVVAGLEDDTYVLTNLVDAPAHPAVVGKVMYWVNEVDKLRPHVGKRIQFDAMIKDVDRSEIEVKAPEGTPSNIVEIEGPGRDVKAIPEQIGVSSAREPEENDIKTTLVELKSLTNMRVLSGNCPVPGAAATEVAAVRETETRTAVVEVPPAPAPPPAPVTAVTEVAETVVRTPERVAEAVVETPVPAPAPPPAPVVALEAPRTELPRTATALPLVALIGLGSLAAGGALRLRRRQ